MTSKSYPIIQAIKKLEYFCAYQERCHQEVVQKARELHLSDSEIEEAIVMLISTNFLNEERFACSFARGKHNIKYWGKNRIINELKQRNITQYLINKALQEIPDTDYIANFESLAQKQWIAIREKNQWKKKKKFCDFLLRKGYESYLILDKYNDFLATEEASL